MADGGWIKLYRSVRANWLWENGNERYAKWWIDILMMVNHEPRKILVNGKLVTIGVGERLTSISKLAAGWGATRRTVDRFLALLVEDHMIEITKSREEGTRVKVLNYAVYQANSGETVKGSAQREAQGMAQQPAQRTAHKQEPKEPKNDKNTTTTTEECAAVGFYEQNFGQLSPLLIQKVDGWVQDFQEIGADEAMANQILVKGMEIAIVRNKRSFGYVEGILRDWEGKGLTSVAAIEGEEAKFKAEKQQRTGQRQHRSVTEPPPSDYQYSDDDLPF